LSQADMGHLRRQTQESGPEDRFPNNSDWRFIRAAHIFSVSWG
jgi:hypothetical protein